MEKIVIGFSTPKKWKPFAWLIRAGYGTPYSHVYIKLWSEKYQRHLIYQASGLTVNFIGCERFSKINRVIQEFEFDISSETKIELMKYAIDTCGARYGIKQVAGMAMVRFGEIFGTKIKSPFKDGENSFVCSELASYVLAEFVGAKLPKLPDDMTPKDIYNLTLQLAGTVNNGTCSKNT